MLRTYLGPALTRMNRKSSSRTSALYTGLFATAHASQETSCRLSNKAIYSVSVSLSRGVCRHFGPKSCESSSIMGLKRISPALTQSSATALTFSRRPESRSIVFRVPDDTDVEDIASDDDFSIRSSIKVLRENGLHPAQPEETSKALAIDLTSEEDDNEFNFSDLRVIEGQRVEHGEWDSSSSVKSPATSAVQTPCVVNSAVIALDETPAKGPDPVLNDGEEADGDESVDLDGAIGCGLGKPTVSHTRRTC